MGFVELPKTDAETISWSILSCMEGWEEDVIRLRGQDCEGKTMMGGDVAGV
jgi:hypothetical protein